MTGVPALCEVSSLGHFQKPRARHPQIAQRKQRHQVGRILGPPPVLDLYEAKLPLDDPKRVYHLGPNAGLGLLRGVPGRRSLEPKTFRVILANWQPQNLLLWFRIETRPA